MDKKPLTIDDAIAFTGYRRSYLYKLMSQGRIPYYRPTNGKAFFLQEDLEAFLLRGRRAADYELAAQADATLAGK